MTRNQERPGSTGGLAQQAEAGPATARRPGRPPLDPEERKKPFCFRVITERVGRLWMVAAARAGMSLSAWMRSCLDGSARCELDGDDRFRPPVMILGKDTRGGGKDRTVKRTVTRTPATTAKKAGAEGKHAVAVSATVNRPMADGSVEKKSISVRKRFDDEESAERWMERIGELLAELAAAGKKQAKR